MRGVILGLLLTTASAHASSDIGIVVLHGLQGMPGSIVTSRFEAALNYASSHPDIAGVIGLAPAGNPTGLMRGPEVQQSVATAEQMVASGHGNDLGTFVSGNNREHFTVTTSAAIFLGFTDPHGPAVFPRILPKVTPPVLWVAGDADRSQTSAGAWFVALPPNRLNRMAHVSATHPGTRYAAIARRWTGCER